MITKDSKQRRVTHYTAIGFLQEVEALARQGWVTSMIPPGFPEGVYDVVMASGHPTARVARARDVLPLYGPYTRSQMVTMGFPELRNRANTEYGLTDRGLNGLIRKVLKYQEEEQDVTQRD